MNTIVAVLVAVFGFIFFARFGYYFNLGYYFPCKKKYFAENGVVLRCTL